MVMRSHQSAKTSKINTKHGHSRQSREAGSCLGRIAASQLFIILIPHVGGHVSRFLKNLGFKWPHNPRVRSKHEGVGSGWGRNDTLSVSANHRRWS